MRAFRANHPPSMSARPNWSLLLTHLMPPTGCSPIRLDRFSPFHTNPSSFGFERVRPANAYYYVFPLERRELSRLAYFFEFDYADGRDPNSYLNHLREEISKWWSAQSGDSDKPGLDAKPHADGLLIEDTRSIAMEHRNVLSGIPAQLYLACDTARNISTLARPFSHEMDEYKVRTILDSFVAAKTMIKIDDHYLSLAVFRERTLLKELTQSSDSPQVHQAPASEPLLRVV